MKIKSKLFNFFYSNKFITFAILVEVLILTTYWLNDPKIIAKDFYDSVDYLDYAISIKGGFKYLFSDFRAPVYPLILFLLGIKKLTDSNLNLYIIQTLLHISALTLSWFTFSKIRTNKYIKYTVFVFLVTGIDYFWMTKTMLSETTATFLMALYTFIFINWLETKKTYWFLFSILTLLFLIFTRPFYVFLIGLNIVTLFLILNKKDLKKWVQCISILVMFTAIIVSYNFANYKKFNYFGISTEGGTNLFSRIAEYPEFLPKEYSKNPKLLLRAKTCRLHNKEDSFSCIWEFYPHGNITSKRDDKRSKEIDDFSKTMLIKNFVPLSIKAIPYFLQTTQDPYIKNGNSDDGKPYNYWYGLKQNQPFVFVLKIFTYHQEILHYFFTFSIFVLGIPLYIYHSIKLLIQKNKKLSDTTIWSVYSVIFYHIVLTGYLAIGDMGRMLKPVLPLIYLLSVWNIFEVTKISKNIFPKKLKNYFKITSTKFLKS